MVSYKPFNQNRSCPPNLGRDNRLIITSVQIQNAPFIFIGLKTRERSNPAENENSTRSDPPVKFISVSAYPAPKSPSGPVMAKTANPPPTSATKIANPHVGNRRMNNA